ncbi:MAG TPA: hypothetical protein VFC46_07295 [Humisphaera sp.]|nr:hypothetical protein [Humisphaera sp.]
MASKSLSKAERLRIVFSRLRDAPPAKNANEAMATMNRLLDDVEDEFSGVPKDPNPPRTATARMYAPQSDSIVMDDDGNLIAVSAGHIVVYGADGSIRIEQRASGRVVFRKAGTG